MPTPARCGCWRRPCFEAAAHGALKARMQGKSCFSFKACEPALFEELAVLTRAGYAHCVAQGWAPA